MRIKLSISIFLGLILTILLPIIVSAEVLNIGNFEHLSIDQGLSNEQVTSIYQDSKGYMWIGTIDGLNRFDGERFKVYNCDLDNEDKLSSNYINVIQEDSKGNLWIGTDCGLDFLVKETNTIVRMKDLEKGKFNLGNLKITSLLSDNNIMWVGTEKGLIKIDIEKSTIDALYHDKSAENSLTNSYIKCIEEDINNNLWVGTTSGINIVNKTNLSVIYSENEIKNNKPFIYDIEFDSSGKMWISTKDGIFISDITKGKKGISGIKNYENLKENKIKDFYDDIGISENIYNNKSLLIDSKDNMWISSSNGIMKYSLKDETIDMFKKDTRQNNSITSNFVSCFYEDSNGTIWVGTDKGVNILNRGNRFYTNYEYAKKTDFLYDKNIISILMNNKYIWVATKYDGIYIYNIETRSLEKNINLEDFDKNLRGQYIKHLFKITDNNVDVVTNKYIVSINTKDLTYKTHLIEGGYSSEANYMYSDDDGIIWIASTTNLISFNTKTGEKTYHNENLTRFEINPGGIKYILQDNEDNNTLWLGGTGIGLVKYNKEKGVMEQYNSNSNDKNSLISNNINCINFDNSGNLWIGTNIGLSKFNIKTNKFNSYTTSEGLTNNFINSILVDNNNDIWVSTNKGLNKLDIESENIINFTKMDGILGYQFNLNSSLKTIKGNLMFGSTNGFIYFNPNEIKNPISNKNKVVIGDIFVGKNKLNYDGNELVLEYKENDLFIEYFLPNYENLSQTSYQYMIEGLDTQWTYIDNKNFLDIKSLNPGRYTLKLRARDGHGNLTEETKMSIKVKNPIWKTPLAYLIYIAVIISIIVYIFNYVKILHNLVNQKTKSLNKQLKENKKLSEEIIQNEKFKNNYFVNLSHELRTPINVISSTVQLINNVNKNLTYEKSEKYMNIISKSCDNLLKIINDIIDSSKIETGQYKIYKKNKDIVYIVEEAALNMSKFIEGKGLSLVIDPEIEEKVISCDATEIERCIINLLANAVKFTPEGGEITVYIREVEKYIEITVEDNGIGISKEDQNFIFKRFSQVEGNGATKASSSGIGLTLVKYIADLHSGYVRLESEISKGSKFTIGLPDKLEDNMFNENLN
ncbi:ligand-binding sensor domain-containing protein [Paraclostridium bifermentans]|uniref:ligand-binding sensor domain-containing protein n=1 Tax=Paraclostridium bifermentans TaxID=1490 RepID=UPI00290A067A|nr:two-component regulator propeller domain-containing protein [Paraclostridium bifermentans]MDU3336846.1 two-component regulator propeller domain-containing protein [Paraclostridium bifermentans]